MGFVNYIKEHRVYNLKQGISSRVLILGSENEYPLNEIIPSMIYHVKNDVPDFHHTIDLIRTSTMFDILRIGHVPEPHKVFDYFYGLVSEGGLIIVDQPGFRLNSSTFGPTILGPTALVYEDDRHVIFLREFIPQDICFAIVMATYYRPTGTSKDFVERSLLSIKNQTYQNYKLFLIGDKYENVEEFNDFKSLIPPEKIEIHNLPVAWERENCKNKYNLWCIGGANAMNHGMDLATNQGYIHYVHLDDDDYWHPFHLRNMAMGYIHYPESTFICTLGVTNTFNILPKVNCLDYNNFKCVQEVVYHSAFGFRLDIHPLRYLTFILGQKEPTMWADGDMLNRIGDRCRNHNLKVLAIPLVTCMHDFEQSSNTTIYKFNTTVLELIDEIKRSRSNQMVMDISKSIKTFHHHYHILYDLRTFLGPNPKTYCEIGVYHGGSSALMLSHPYNTSVIGIDSFEHSIPDKVTKDVMLYSSCNNKQFKLYKADSHLRTTTEILQENGERFDILFIDGDHSYDGVIKDFEMYSPFVNLGGYIVFDDYNDKLHSPKVKCAVDKIVEDIMCNKNGEYEVIGTFQNILNVYPDYMTEYNEFILKKIV